MYVLQDVGAWLSSVRSNEVLHGSAATPHADNWTASEVDGRFDWIYCGPGGLVCAKSSKTLYIRRGVSYDNPLGSSWTKAPCDARDLAVGRECIVRLTSRDQLFVAASLDLSSTGSVFLPHWNCVPSCEAVETHQLFALDSNDNLFLLSPSTGEVHVCPALVSRCPDDYRWTRLIEGPPAVRNQSLSLFRILGLGRSNSKRSVFSSVTGGDGCLWCLGSSGKEVFQLVLDYGRRSERGRKRKTRTEENKVLEIQGSWKRFELPDKDEVTMISTDWTTLDIFCGVARENRAILSYATLQEHSGRVEIPNPVGVGGRWKSISICALPQPTAAENLNEPLENVSVREVEPQSSYPSLYPKLPPLEDFDICCEDGECSFCMRHSFLWEGVSVGRGEEVESEDEGPPDVKRSRNRGSGDEGEGRKRKRKRKRENGDIEGLMSSPKRPHVPVTDQLADVPFKLGSSSSSYTHFLTQHQVYTYSNIPLL